jgi:hypothetical protein
VLPEKKLGTECMVGVRREANILISAAEFEYPAILSDSKFVSRYAKQSHALTEIKSRGRFALSLFASQIVILPPCHSWCLAGK